MIVTLDMPLAKETWRNSSGLLPVSPESASLLENREAAVATWALVASNAARVSGSAYVK